MGSLVQVIIVGSVNSETYRSCC